MPKYAFQVALMAKNLTANAGDFRDMGLIPGSGRCPGGGHGNSLQYSCLENPMDRGAWWATVLWGCTESSTTQVTSMAAWPGTPKHYILEIHSYMSVYYPRTMVR